jgi:hypothetical protein
MSVISYPASSPYAATSQTDWYIENLVFRPIPTDSDDQPFTLLLRHQYRPDRLAFDLYNMPAYWWVFCVRNPFLRRDPIWSFINGLTIIVPTSDYLHRVLGS